MQWRNTHYTEFTIPSPAGNSPRFQLANNQSRAIRDYRLDGNSTHWQATLDFLGYSLLTADGPGGQKVIRRVTPHSTVVPGQDEDPFLYALSIPHLQGITPDGHDFARSQAKYKHNHFQVVYQSVSYKVREDNDPLVLGTDVGWTTVPDESRLNRYVTFVYKPMSRVVTLPRGIMTWIVEGADPATVKVLEAIGKVEPGIRISVIHHLRPDFPIARITAAIGTVNSEDFGPLGQFRAGTMLCVEPDITPIQLPTGRDAFDCQFNFLWLPKLDLAGTARGHNAFLRYLTTTQRYDYRYLNTKANGSGDKPYRTSDHKLLFRPDPP